MATNPIVRLLQSIVAQRGIWAIADQGVVSLGNFVTNILLARSLSVTDYGAFAFVYVVIISLNSAQGAVITYPLTIMGAVEKARQLSSTTAAAGVLTTALAVPFGLGILGTCLFVGKLELTLPVIAAV